MLYSRTDPGSYIAEYTLVYEENKPGGGGQAREGEVSLKRRSHAIILQGVIKSHPPLKAHCFKSHLTDAEKTTHHFLHSGVESELFENFSL